MRRKTALRLYRFLFVTQIIGLCLGSAKAMMVASSGEYKYLLAAMVGLVIGIGLAVLWFRQWKGVEATSEEDWNRIWHIPETQKPNRGVNE